MFAIKNIPILMMIVLSTGCLGSLETVDQDDKNISDQDNYGWGEDSKSFNSDNCYSHLYQVEVDGHLYLVSIPGLCETNFYIYKGDPEVDMGEELRDLDRDTRDKIIEAVFITHNI